MITKAILGFARNLGYKNISEIQAFKRAIKAGSNMGSCHLTLTNPQKTADFSKSILADNPLVDDKVLHILNLSRAQFPQCYAPDVKTTLDIAYKRFGEKSGIVKLAMATENSAGVQLSSVKAKGMTNSSGGRITVDASSNYGVSGQYDISIIPSVFKSHRQENAVELMKNLKYNEVNGTANLSLPQTSLRGFKANADINLPLGYTNLLTGIATNFECPTFGQLLSKCKSLI